MQNGSIALKAGDMVQPGAMIGRVGNTGMTSDRQKGGVTAWYPGKKSGHHLDLKVKIDGKYVDPETLQLPAGQTQPKGPAMLNGVQLGPTREAAARLARQEGKELIDSILFDGKDGI